MLTEINKFTTMQDSQSTLEKHSRALATARSIMAEQACSASERNPLSQEGGKNFQGKEILLQYLFNKSDADYQYELVLEENIPDTLYRERNFSIKLTLCDRSQKVIHNLNNITLSIVLFTNEVPPTAIKQNTLGNQIMKGFLEKDLINGRAAYDKIQIKEVTSHYLNGCISMIIFPQPPKVESKGQHANSSQIIDYAQIKPLILDKIIVKAKKMKNSKNKHACHSSKSEDGKSRSIGEEEKPDEEEEEGCAGQNNEEDCEDECEGEDEDEDEEEEGEEEGEESDEKDVQAEEKQEVVQTEQIIDQQDQRSNQQSNQNIVEKLSTKEDPQQQIKTQQNNPDNSIVQGITEKINFPQI